CTTIAKHTAVSNNYDEIFLQAFAPAQSLARRGAGAELCQGTTDRHERLACSFAAAEVDDEQDADDADVELHERAGIVLIATKGCPVGVELLNDGPESLAQAGNLGGRLLAPPGLECPEGDLILRGCAFERHLQIGALVGAGRPLQDQYRG